MVLTNRNRAQAIFDKVARMLEAAGQAGVNVLCLQEAWSMPFAFCTREREWTEFSEAAETGPSTAFLQVCRVCTANELPHIRGLRHRTVAVVHNAMQVADIRRLVVGTNSYLMH